MRVKVSGEALRTANNVPPSSWEAYLKALGYLQRFDKPRNIDLAISAVLSAVQSDPGFALGYATLGDAYRLKYQTERDPRWLDQAAANCRKALQIDSQLAPARVTLARLEVIGGKNDLALEEFNKALAINPRNAEALYGMGEIYESLGRAADAEATYQRAIALRPDYWGGYNYLAAFYDDQHRPQEAIATFRRVTQMTPDNPIAYSNLGAAYMVLGDPASQAEAQAAFERSLQLAPTYQAYSNLGYLYLIAGRYAEAAEKLRKAVELNDQDWRVLANLMEAYRWLKDTDKSRQIHDKYVRLLEQSAAAAPADTNTQASLGIVYSESGQRQKALECVKSALASGAKDGFVLAGVAQVYENLGDRKRAVQFALDSLANGASLQELQHRLGLQGVLSDPSFRGSSTIRSNGK
jgi:eukaryotic-like serine/threonine-protein kinase